MGDRGIEGVPTSKMGVEGGGYVGAMSDKRSEEVVMAKVEEAATMAITVELD